MDERPQHTGTHVVVGHDGHPAAHAALDIAVGLATQLGAHLHVVHSVTLADFGIDPDTDEFVRQRDRNLAEKREAITSALADAPVGWTYHEEDGDPASRLAELAAELDAPYIVVGATHRGVHLSSGSVSKRLLHIQQRPVVVVPEPHPAGPPRHKHWLAARGR